MRISFLYDTQDNFHCYQNGDVTLQERASVTRCIQTDKNHFNYLGGTNYGINHVSDHYKININNLLLCMGTVVFNKQQINFLIKNWLQKTKVVWVHQLSSVVCKYCP